MPLEKMIRLVPVLPLLVFAPSAHAQEPDSPARYVVECGGQFARTASHDDLVAFYGAENVRFEGVNREEGEVVMATVLFADDPERRLDIEWYDVEKRRLPSTITVFGENNRWTGPFGIRNGMTIGEIEKRAGKPFKINGFGFDVAGAGHFAETKLDTLPGGCAFGAHFDIVGGLPPEHLKRLMGEVEIASDDPDLLTLEPKVWIYTLTYPAASAE